MMQTNNEQPKNDHKIEKNRTFMESSIIVAVSVASFFSVLEVLNAFLKISEGFLFWDIRALIFVVPISIFVFLNDRSNIEDYWFQLLVVFVFYLFGIWYWALMGSVDSEKCIDFYCAMKNTTKIAELATYLGGILTPIGVFLALYEIDTRKKKEIVDILTEELMPSAEMINNELDKEIASLYKNIDEIKECLSENGVLPVSSIALRVEHRLDYISLSMLKEKNSDIVSRVYETLPNWKSYKTPKLVKLEKTIASNKKRGDAAFRILKMIEEEYLPELEVKLKKYYG